MDKSRKGIAIVTNDGIYDIQDLIEKGIVIDKVEPTIINYNAPPVLQYANNPSDGKTRRRERRAAERAQRKGDFRRYYRPSKQI